MTEHPIKFGVLHPDGRVTDERVIERASVKACPHVILIAEHYREDESCRCDDPDHTEMVEWGYTWRDGQWC